MAAAAATVTIDGDRPSIGVVVIPASVLIAATGVFWTIQRIWLATR